MLQTMAGPLRGPETSAANLRARAIEAVLGRATISEILYPALRSEIARAAPKLPAPTIATVGFEAMLRRITKAGT